MSPTKKAGPGQGIKLSFLLHDDDFEERAFSFLLPTGHFGFNVEIEV